MTTKRMLLVALLLVLIMTPLSTAQAAKRTISSPVHLKINDYYVLYTSPAPPFIDERNRLMIPLRTVSDLLGAKVAYDPKTKTAVVSFGTDTLQLAVGSATAHVNGQALEMDTVPVMIRQSMFIPAKVLMEAFHIAGEWDRAHRILTLKDDRFFNVAIEHFKDLELKDASVSDRVFVPRSFELQYEISEIEMDGEILSWLDQRLNMNMKNAENRAFTAEEVDIRVLTSIVDGLYSVSHHYSEPVEAGATFDVSFDGSGGGSWKANDIRFIAVFSRLLPRRS
jgi:hypothetical protein